MARLTIASVNILTTFTQASTRANITSGENLPISLGKISKYIASTPGLIVDSGTTYTHGGTTYTTGTGAEIFNEYTSNEAAGDYSHAEGYSSQALGSYSHSEGFNNSAKGTASHAEGTGTIAASSNQHVQGTYNTSDANNTFAFIIGNGTDDSHRSNALAIDWDGKLYPNGSQTAIDLSLITNILYNTTKGWEAQTMLISQPNTIYVYTDYKSTGPYTTHYIPGIKIGNGNAYLIDLPFITDWIVSGLVTSTERASWNNKVTADIDGTDTECLVLSKT